ncbi:hypothetical protein TNCV_1611821 [Trichonephila clavipes]|nr:hypothetical protein TNCV_1611821 [Trichonephila clavipes]
MASVDFQHQGNPPTRAGVQKASDKPTTPPSRLFNLILINERLSRSCPTRDLSPGPVEYFNENVTSDDGLPICATEVQEVVNLLERMDNDSDAEIGNDTPVKTATFSNALHCLKTEKIPKAQHVANDAMFSSLLEV